MTNRDKSIVRKMRTGRNVKEVYDKIGSGPLNRLTIEETMALTGALKELQVALYKDMLSMGYLTNYAITELTQGEEHE